MLRYQDLEPGLVAPALELELSRTDLVMYAGASGDFNPMHHDEIRATAAGLPSTFGHGMLSMGLVSTAVTNFAGIGNLRKISVRFVKQTWPGEVLRTSVTVAEKLDPEKGLVRLDCALENAAGEVKLSGSAIIEAQR